MAIITHHKCIQVYILLCIIFCQPQILMAKDKNLTTPQKTEEAVAQKARLGGDIKTTRFVVELSRVVKFNAFVLIDPYRVVIDLPEVQFNFPLGYSNKGRGLIKRFRYGLFSDGRSRIVIDAKKAVKIDKAFVLKPTKDKPARLVVDIKAIPHQEMDEKHALNGKKSRQIMQEQDKEIIELLKKRSEKLYKKPIVVIDAGHGGIDPGAVSPEGMLEKEIVLDFVKKLGKNLINTGKYEVLLTRDKDIFISLRDRVTFARKHKADIFISVHADSVEEKDSNIKGMTVYTLSEKASDSQAAALARKENSADVIAGLDLKTTSKQVKSILIDLAQRETKIYSEELALALINSLKEKAELNQNPKRSAGFYVLKAPDVPSVLIELGYLSTKSDVSRITSQTAQEKMMKGITMALEKYFEKQVAFYKQ